MLNVGKRQAKQRLKKLKIIAGLKKKIVYLRVDDFFDFV
ncbi:hypothetical protein EV214_11743 [Marinisporobacter balticus]|uniref:Uncharacterized protein n=1 Tax=Marinisporobacter balticus TaxID=2018667 RepID=A0A4R2KPB0_9FIRM|nr:hypothetical protein EV214_11743 [Marinisporobacter balticus]